MYPTTPAIVLILLAGTAFAQPPEARLASGLLTVTQTTVEIAAGGSADNETPDDGWAEESWEEDGWDASEESPWAGFVELAAGTRRENDPATRHHTTLEEARWRLERTWRLDSGRLDFRGDLLADAVTDDLDADLRELAYAFSRGKADVRLGRQVLTWGTGDQVFLNDLFPKGWVSFFAGRDDEYLKAPSDALRVTYFNRLFNVDIAAIPRFAPDEYLSGARFSFFSPQAGANVAPMPPLSADEPTTRLNHIEWAMRVFKNSGSNELSVYAYDGYYHQPSPSGPGGLLAFPRLRALGASWRRPLGPGIFNTEAAQHTSIDDRAGSNPSIPNSQFRFLLGFEWEAVANLTAGFQYYIERTLDHEALLANSAWPQFEVEKSRTWLTNRLTWRTRQDRVVWSLFSFYSPTDHDAYLRPRVSWRRSDAWLFTAGGNLFSGNRPSTFFAQFEDASNIFVRARFIY